MRRALLLFLAAQPALALGQSVTFKTASNASFSVINKAQCTGSDSSGAHLSDDSTVDITWTIKAAGGTGTGGVYKIYVSPKESQAGKTLTSTSTGTDCTKDINDGSVNAVQLVGDLNVNSTTQTETGVSLQDFAAKVGLNCTDQSTVNLYVCVQQVSSANVILGYATATLALDRTVPPTPVSVSTSPGDGTLHISCQAGSGDSVPSGGGYKAVATNSTLSPGYSNEATSCGDLIIDGLTNGQTYNVVVYRLNEHHNPSAPSVAVNGTPIPTSDYWNEYKDGGGREAGGCNTAAGAAGLLGALSILVALRRRKS